MIILWPVLLCSQSDDHVLDSLEAMLDTESTPKELAARYLNVLWYNYRNEEGSYKHYPQQLDSLYDCCLAGKTGDAAYEKHIHADAIFFESAAMVYEDPGAAKLLVRKAMPLYAALDDSTSLVLCYLQLTIVASGQGDSLAFASTYDTATTMLSHVKDAYLQALFHCNIGIGCYDFGRYADAAGHYFEALALIEKYKTPEMLSGLRDIYHNIAGIYSRLGDSDNAIIYIEKAIQSSKETHQNPDDNISMLGWIYMERKEFQKALDAFQKVDPDNHAGFNRIAEKTYGLATCYRNLGDVKTALPLAQKAVELLPITVNVHYGSAALSELASCEFATGMTDLALEHAQLAYVTFSRGKNNRGASEAAELISNIYKSKGDYVNALKYSEERYRYQFQVERQTSNRQLAFGEFTRDNAAKTAKREAEVKAELNRQRYIRYGLFAGLGMLAVLAVLLYNRFRFKQRTTEQLEIKNKEIEAARKRAEASEAFKSRFLANMSHEIRTPLHGISGFTGLLLETSLNEKQHRWLSSIQYSTDRLSDVVNDILDISKLEAGEVKLRQIPFSPSRLVADVQDGLRMKAEKNGTQLIVRIADDVPKALLGDPTRLYQILMNLAGNAVKFTENGSVTLSVKSTLDTPQSHTSLTSHDLTLLRSCALTFCVSDTGIGIKPEKLSSIFESFQQAEDDTTARFGGTGLGLTIARQLVRLHHSDIRVTSEWGKGSTFSFDLILQEADPLSLAEEHSKGDVLQFDQPVRILLADDNALNREIAVEAIKRHFEKAIVSEAINGKEAVDILQLHDFDIVLMDMQMPVLTGTQATQEIRALKDPRKYSIPIIALTASATPEEIESALRSGMNGHLGKPFKPRELASVIATTLHLENITTEIETISMHHPTTSDHLIQSENLPDLSFLFEFTEGDRAQMIHFIQKFLEQYPSSVAEMEIAIAENDPDTLYRAAHSFRPQLEFVGLKKQAAILLQMEHSARDGGNMELFTIQVKEMKDALLSLPQAEEWLMISDR